jgi:hypothetical protein
MESQYGGMAVDELRYLSFHFFPDVEEGHRILGNVLSTTLPSHTHIDPLTR